MGLGGWIKSGASAVGGAIKSGAEVLEDAIEEVGDAAEGLGDELGSFIANSACSAGNDILCGAATGLSGVLSGTTSWLGGLTRGSGKVLGGGISSLGNAFQGRWRDALEDLLGSGISSLALFFEGISLPGRWVDETVRHWQRDELRKFVADLIDESFASEPRRAAAREIAGVNNSPWGMSIHAIHRQLAFVSPTVPLGDLHRSDAINLYELAGFEHYGSFTEARPQALVHRADDQALEPVSRDQIDDYLNSGSPDLSVLPMNPKNAARSMRYAQQICKDIGIILSWSGSERSTLAVEQIDQVRYSGEVLPFPLVWFDARSAYQDLLRRAKLRDGTMSTECTLVAFATLFVRRGDHLSRGVAHGVDLHDDGRRCSTANRDDGCCAILIRDGNTGVMGTTVAYIWPRNAAARATNQFILAHEIGHWLGLCHLGHRRLTEVMYTEEDYPLLNAIWTATLLGRGAQRPRFTGPDGRNVWRFILDQRAEACFPAQPSPVE